MSQTLETPVASAEPAMVTWHGVMKQAFKAGGGAAPDTGPAAGPSAGRLATLRKTFANVRIQAPEIAIRPIQEIASELAVAELTVTEAGGRLPSDDIAFRRQVDVELDGLKQRAADIVAGHVAKWQDKISKLPVAATDALPAVKSARAKAIQTLLADIEPGITRDEYMLRQVGAMPAALGDISGQAALLKTEYKKLLPKRTTSAAPTVLPAVTKPAIKGELSKEESAQLAKAMKDTQALMGSDRQTDPAVVDKACKLIEKGINVGNADAEMKRLKTWVAVKEKYRAEAKTDPEKAKKFMAEMWWFRRMKVDAVMTKLQKDYDFIWGSVGSDNPESDYDLTVRTHPRRPDDKVKWDYQIVELANKELSKDYGGVPPGILFDTNLYAEAAVTPQELTEEEKSDPTIKAMAAMKEQGQDVGALMKLRRFMEWDEYEDYKTGMLKAITDPADRALVLQQFEEADALFFIARTEQLRTAAEQNPDKDAGKRELAEINALPTTPEGQKKLAELAENLEHDSARSMAANNAIYVDKLTEVRKLEQQYNEETDPKAKVALLARLKSYQADATFFAAEAYHSEGPLQHVVKAGQSSKLEIEGDGITYEPDAKAAAIEAKKQEKLRALSPNQMLQSFNENLGDLLKDLRHYASEPFPGLGFYRSSKYIERLCDAFSVIAPKLPGDAQTAFLSLKIDVKAPADVQRAVAGLVDIRGEKKGFVEGDDGPADAEQEKQAYAIEEMTKIFPKVVTLPDLAKVISTFGQQVNALVRSAITKDMRALDANPYFPKTKEG
jgi:hypothetical protein